MRGITLCSAFQNCRCIVKLTLAARGIYNSRVEKRRANEILSCEFEENILNMDLRKSLNFLESCTHHWLCSFDYSASSDIVFYFSTSCFFFFYFFFFCLWKGQCINSGKRHEEEKKNLQHNECWLPSKNFTHKFS